MADEAPSAPDGPPGPPDPDDALAWWWRVWLCVVGWVSSGASIDRRLATYKARELAARAAEARARTEAERATMELDSARAVITSRDAEIAALQANEAKLQATVQIREKELTELTLWTERSRMRLQADIAVECAREARATDPTARPAGGSEV